MVESWEVERWQQLQAAAVDEARPNVRPATRPLTMLLLVAPWAVCSALGWYY